MDKGTGRKGGFVLLCALSALGLVGCQGNGEPIQPVTAALPAKPTMDMTAPSGVPIAKGAPVDARSMPEAKNLVARNDSFALTPEESAFDASQRTESLLTAAGGYVTRVDLEARDTEPDPPRMQPVPAWRLAGVIVGNGVMALLDTGRETIEIRPGMRIPGTEWTVVSIDSEKATLRREGKDLPHEFQVGLAGPIGNVTVQGRGAAASGAGGGGASGGNLGGAG